MNIIIVLQGFLNNHEQCNLLNIKKINVELRVVRACRAPRRGSPPFFLRFKSSAASVSYSFLRNLLCITLNVFPEYNQKDPPRPSKECKGNAAHQFKNYYDFTLNGTIGLWRDFSISEHGFLECLFHSPNVRFPALDG